MDEAFDETRAARAKMSNTNDADEAAHQSSTSLGKRAREIDAVDFERESPGSH